MKAKNAKAVKKAQGSEVKKGKVGRKRIYKEPALLNFKTEKSLKVAVKEKFGKELNTMFNLWLKSLL